MACYEAVARRACSLADTSLDRRRQNAYKSTHRGEALRLVALRRRLVLMRRFAARASAEHHAVQGETAMPLYEQGAIRIHYEEVGSGFPLLVIPGGGLNSTVAGLATHPFNPMDEFKDEFRVIAADLRNAKGGQSTGPLDVDRPWDAYTDDQLGLMDHLGIRDFMVLGFCIGGPFIWNLLQAGRGPRRRRRAGAAQRLPPGDARPLLHQQHAGLGPGAVRSPARHHDGDGRDLPDQYVRRCPRRLCVHGDPRFRARSARRRSWCCPTTCRRTRTPSRWRPCIWRRTRR